MPIGIPKIEANAAPGPLEGAFDSNTVLPKSVLPGRQTLDWNAKAYVRGAGTIVRRYHAEWEDCPLRVASAIEQKQHLSAVHTHRAKPLVLLHHRIPKKTGVEIACAWQVRHVKTSLQNC